MEQKNDWKLDKSILSKIANEAYFVSRNSYKLN